ncbi:MAG: hypothetical protein QM820_40720 [Minicystis sp.]
MNTTGCWARREHGLVSVAELREAVARAGAEAPVFDAGEAEFAAYGEAARIRVGDAGELVALQPEDDDDVFRLAARGEDRRAPGWQVLADAGDVVAAALRLRFDARDGVQLVEQRLRERDERFDSLDVTELRLTFRARPAGAADEVEHVETLAAAPLARVRRGQLRALETAVRTAASAASTSHRGGDPPRGFDDLVRWIEASGTYAHEEPEGECVRVRRAEDEDGDRTASLIFVGERVSLYAWPELDLDPQGGLLANATMRVAALAVDVDGEWELNARRLVADVRESGPLALTGWLDAFFADLERLLEHAEASDDESDGEDETDDEESEDDESDDDEDDEDEDDETDDEESEDDESDDEDDDEDDDETDDEDDEDEDG